MYADHSFWGKVIEVLDYNISVSEIYTYYLSNIPTSIKKERIQKHLLNQSLEDSFFSSLLDVLGLNRKEIENYCFLLIAGEM